MLCTRQCSRRLSTARYRLVHTRHDDCGIPNKPTWSVDELLSSYPSPTLSSATLLRLHQLSALIPPAEGTTEHRTLKKELEEFVRLVEAVKLVDTRGIQPAMSHGRIDEQTHHKLPQMGECEVNGTQLLKHATHEQDGFYVVDSDKMR